MDMYQIFWDICQGRNIWAMSYPCKTNIGNIQLISKIANLGITSNIFEFRLQDRLKLTREFFL